MSEFEFDFDVEEVTAPVVEIVAEIVEKVQYSVDVELDFETHHIFKAQESFKPAQEVLSVREAHARIEAELLAVTELRNTFEIKRENLRKEFDKAMLALNEEAAPLDGIIWDKRKELRQAQYNIQAAENVLREALNNEKLRKTFLENATKFDAITAGFKWREFAFEHQIEGAKLLAISKRAILGDKMGLGKTLTSLIFCDMVQAQRVLIIVPDDVVSNFTREIAHWAPHRAAVMLGKRTKAERKMLLDVLETLEAFTVVLNYSAWRKDKNLLKRLVALKFDTVIMDESHSVKNTSTSAFRGCEQIVLSENSCPQCRGNIQHVTDDSDRENAYADNGAYLPRNFFVCMGTKPVSESTKLIQNLPMHDGCGWTELVDIAAGNTREYGSKRSVQHVIPMTGTVILNKPTDIFAQLKLIDDKTFHNQNEFVRSYCEKDQYTGVVQFKYGGLEALTKKLAGRYVARDRKSAGVVLPKQDTIIHDIEMDKTAYPDQYKVIQQLTKHAMVMLENGDSMPIPAIIALITRKRQANVHPAGIEMRDPLTGEILFSVGDEVNESIKLDKIIMEPSRTESGEYEGLIPDLTGNGDMINGERVVVFSQFKTPLAELETRLNAAGISVVRFDGSTPQMLRDAVKLDFDRKYCDQEGYKPKWQVVLCNYKTGGVGLNFTGATQMIMLDEEWNGGKADQAAGRIDRIGQTEETCVHILRIENSIDTWMANLIANKRDMVEGFESNANLASNLLEFLKNEDI